MYFQLAEPGKIRGDQLSDELLKATGRDLSDRITMHANDMSRVHVLVDDLDFDTVSLIRDTVAAHNPDPLYFQDEKDSAALWGKVQQAASGAAGKLFTDLTAAEVRALLVCVLRRMKALDKDGRVKPLDTWAK